jgi:hypothetical protein
VTKASNSDSHRIVTCSQSCVVRARAYFAVLTLNSMYCHVIVCDAVVVVVVVVDDDDDDDDVGSVFVSISISFEFSTDEMRHEHRSLIEYFLVAFAYEYSLDFHDEVPRDFDEPIPV